MYACQECGRKFKTAAAAARAINNGCPNCGGVDIDIDNGPTARDRNCDLPITAAFTDLVHFEPGQLE